MRRNDCRELLTRGRDGTVFVPSAPQLAATAALLVQAGRAVIGRALDR